MNIKKVELWTNVCYSCHRNDFRELHDWYLSLGMPLGNFETIRIPLKKEWQDFAKRMKDEANIEPPFVVFRVEDKDYQAFIYRYEDFKEQIERNKMFITKEEQEKIARNILVKDNSEDTQTIQLSKKPVTKKQGIVKKNKTKTTEVK